MRSCMRERERERERERRTEQDGQTGTDGDLILVISDLNDSHSAKS